jgi:hypothetical protein
MLLRMYSFSSLLVSYFIHTATINPLRPKKAQMGPHVFLAILKSFVEGFIGSINYVFEKTQTMYFTQSNDIKSFFI